MGSGLAKNRYAHDFDCSPNKPAYIYKLFFQGYCPDVSILLPFLVSLHDRCFVGPIWFNTWITILTFYQASHADKEWKQVIDCICDRFFRQSLQQAEIRYMLDHFCFSSFLFSKFLVAIPHKTPVFHDFLADCCVARRNLVFQKLHEMNLDWETDIFLVFTKLKDEKDRKFFRKKLQSYTSFWEEKYFWQTFLQFATEENRCILEAMIPEQILERWLIGFGDQLKYEAAISRVFQSCDLCDFILSYY